ncbi:uncharacterized protein LOC130957076 [Arachis stenosperma]|uniref:uncharacterized protein LOC130957076 n=1 Tax=Arachis stenosperma TaxID=217475 RepID=UPI0025AD3E5C|nr:uncharacterized protein LOC130957076 [Arachis stenosperma]
MRDRPTASLSKSQIEAFLSSAKSHRRTEENPTAGARPSLQPSTQQRLLESLLTTPPATSPPPVHPAAFLEPPPTSPRPTSPPQSTHQRFWSPPTTSPRPTSPPQVHPAAALEPTHPATDCSIQVHMEPEPSIQLFSAGSVLNDLNFSCLFIAGSVLVYC